MENPSTPVSKLVDMETLQEALKAAFGMYDYNYESIPFSHVPRCKAQIAASGTGIDIVFFDTNVGFTRTTPCLHVNLHEPADGQNTRPIVRIYTNLPICEDEVLMVAWPLINKFVKQALKEYGLLPIDQVIPRYGFEEMLESSARMIIQLTRTGSEVSDIKTEAWKLRFFAWGDSTMENQKKIIVRILIDFGIQGSPAEKYHLLQDLRTEFLRMGIFRLSPLS